MSSSTADQPSLIGEEISLQSVNSRKGFCGKLMSYSSLHRSIVTVYVSPEQYPFYFHKGRLCQLSSFFEKAFYGSFEEATTGSVYLKEDGVDEFKLFEEWVYSKTLSYPKGSDDPSLLLIKVFCFAEKVRISDLQNATLDAIRDRATGQQISRPTPNFPSGIFAKPQTFFASPQQPAFDFQTHLTTTTSPGLEETVAKYLAPASSSAIHYAYQNTPDSSPLRKLLADIFAFNVKPETLDESLLGLPAEFMADVVIINMKRLPLRLGNEKADFDLNADKYHIEDTSHDRRSRVIECVRDGSLHEGATKAAVDNEEEMWGSFEESKPSSGKGKKKGKRST